MSTPPVTPQPPTTETSSVPQLHGFAKYFNLAMMAVLGAQQLGIGQPGATKAQIALGLVNDGLAVTSAAVPSAVPVIKTVAGLEPSFIALFTGIVDLFKHHNVPGFTK